MDGQPISHSTANEVSQLRSTDATMELTPNTRLSDFLEEAESLQKLTSQRHPTANGSGSENNFDESHKHKTLSSYDRGQVSKKSRASLVSMVPYAQQI